VAVDLTLCEASGQPLDMGTAFDEMTEQSFHGATGISPTAQHNRSLLLALMQQSGWTHHPYEWWHYNLPDPNRYALLGDGAEGRCLMD
jgi:D-alanyl-D-alanine dipeptidase